MSIKGFKFDGVVHKYDYNSLDNIPDLNTETDKTLAIDGVPADAKATGDRISNLQSLVGSPLTASTAASMIDTNKVYVYTGSETGYTNGNWYYHDGTSWVSGGVYNSVAVDLDSTLKLANKAPDSKVVGDAISSLNEDITNSLDSVDAEIGELKENLSEMNTATSEDVGKALLAKTVSDGKVTEWEFGEAGGSDIYETVNLIEEPYITYNSNTNNVTDNEDGTFTIGTAEYGSTEFDSPITLKAGKYTLFGTPTGFVYVSKTNNNYNNTVARNDTAEAKEIQIAEDGAYYIGIRVQPKPAEAFTIAPSLMQKSVRFVEKSDYEGDMFADVDILTDKTRGDGTTNPAAIDNGDGTFTIGSSSYGTLMIGEPMTLQPGEYTLPGVPAGFSFISVNKAVRNKNSVLVANDSSKPLRFSLDEEKTCYIGYRNSTNPANDWVYSPYLLKYTSKFASYNDISEVNEAVSTIREDVEEAKQMASAFVVGIDEHLGYNLYANADGTLNGPSANSKRGYTEPDVIPAKNVHVSILLTGVRVYIHERKNGRFWYNTLDTRLTEFDHAFSPETDMWFMEYSTGSDIPTDITVAKVAITNVADRLKLLSAKDYMYEIYRQQATVLRREKSGSEGSAECAFKAILVSDVHGQADRMLDVVKLTNEWGTAYFDALINCGDTLNMGSDAVDWYYTATADLAVPHINTIGNHEVNNVQHDVAYSKIIAPIASQTGLTQPENAESLSLCYYYYDFAYVRIIVLDATDWTEAQATWFESVLDSALTGGKYVIACSHYHFAQTISTHIACNWSIKDSYSAAINVAAAEKVAAFKQAGGTFICWLCGHEHGDNLHVLRSYENQLVVTLPALTQRAVTLYPNSEKGTYNYDVMTYFVVDDHMKHIKLMRFGADIDMYGVKKSGVVLDYQAGELVASF